MTLQKRLPPKSTFATLRRIAGVIFLCSILNQTSPTQQSEHSTADILAELIRIDTSNPPGNEGKVSEFLAQRLRPLGFDIRIVATPEPGKAHFIGLL